MTLARANSDSRPGANATSHSRRAQQDADRRLRILAEIIGPLTRSLGANYEIVLHDYRIPDRSVVAVAGRVTERQVGRHDNLTLARAIYRGRVSQIFL